MCKDPNEVNGANPKESAEEEELEKNIKKPCINFYSYQVKYELNKNYEADQSRNWNYNFL